MKKIVITAGGTSEKIDNVRKITNYSSGKTGKAIADEFLKDENTFIYYICTKDSARPTSDRVKIIEVEGTMDLKTAVEMVLITDSIDYFVHSMAVSDYMKDYVTTMEKIKYSITHNDDVDEAFRNIEVIEGNKLSSYENSLVIVLRPTPKIISLIKKYSPTTFLVGFKLLDGVSKEKLINVATRLRDKNNCDLVVANDLSTIKEGNHKAYIIDKEDNIEEANGKEDIAKKLVRRIKNEKR
jgi:phosphopantothenate-cysteine ligase